MPTGPVVCCLWWKPTPFGTFSFRNNVRSQFFSSFLAMWTTFWQVCRFPLLDSFLCSQSLWCWLYRQAHILPDPRKFCCAEWLWGWALSAGLHPFFVRLSACLCFYRGVLVLPRLALNSQSMTGLNLNSWLLLTGIRGRRHCAWPLQHSFFKKGNKMLCQSQT